MKQKINSYIYGNKEKIQNLISYLYNNAEPSYQENRSCSYICNFLSDEGFKVQRNFLDVKNSFYAEKGDGYPKICYICEYDAVKNQGHITGHNFISAASCAAASALADSLEDKEKSGTVVVLGCPGEYLGGSKDIMVQQKVFDDIDAVMLVHPDINTFESGTSSCTVPLGLEYLSQGNSGCADKNSFTPLDAGLLTLNMLNYVKKIFPEGLDVSYMIENSSESATPLCIPNKYTLKFYIKSKSCTLSDFAENKIHEIADSISNISGIEHKFFLYECPNKELITNSALSRIFTNNLKESGIIHINPQKEITGGLSIGDVSHVVPCIHPYVSIIEEDNENIPYGSVEFSKATVTDYSLEQCLKSARALASTGADLITNENLLSEIKSEFFNLR